MQSEYAKCNRNCFVGNPMAQVAGFGPKSDDLGNRTIKIEKWHGLYIEDVIHDSK